MGNKTKKATKEKERKRKIIERKKPKEKQNEYMMLKRKKRKMKRGRELKWE